MGDRSKSEMNTMMAVISDVVLTALIAAVLAVYMEWSRRRTTSKIESVEAIAVIAKDTGSETNKKADEISKAVNGGYGAMNLEIKTLKEENVALGKEKATLEEYHRAQEEANLKRQAKQEAVVELQTTITKPKEP